MPRIKNRISIRYSRLIVIKFAGRDWDGRILWFCRCNCGKETIVRGDDLQSGGTKSCGCLNQEKASKTCIELNKKQIGINHPNYINGFRCNHNLKIIQQLKEKKRKENNYTCQDCGITQKEVERKLDVHHIDGNNANNAEENMITLCHSCHQKLHKKNGKQD